MIHLYNRIIFFFCKNILNVINYIVNFLDFNFNKKKEFFKIYETINNKILYKFNSDIYEYDINNHILKKYHEKLYMKPIILKNIKKKDEIVNLKKICNKNFAKNQFEYLNCKNKCNFVDKLFKHDCIKKCDFYLIPLIGINVLKIFKKLILI